YSLRVLQSQFLINPPCARRSAARRTFSLTRERRPNIHRPGRIFPGRPRLPRAWDGALTLRTHAAWCGGAGATPDVLKSSGQPYGAREPGGGRPPCKVRQPGQARGFAGFGPPRYDRRGKVPASRAEPLRPAVSKTTPAAAVTDGGTLRTCRLWG